MPVNQISPVITKPFNSLSIEMPQVLKNLHKETASQPINTLHIHIKEARTSTQNSPEVEISISSLKPTEEEAFYTLRILNLSATDKPYDQPESPKGYHHLVKSTDFESNYKLFTETLDAMIIKRKKQHNKTKEEKEIALERKQRKQRKADKPLHLDLNRLVKPPEFAKNLWQDAALPVTTEATEPTSKERHSEPLPVATMTTQSNSKNTTTSVSSLDDFDNLCLTDFEPNSPPRDLDTPPSTPPSNESESNNLMLPLGTAHQHWEPSEEAKKQEQTRIAAINSAAQEANAFFASSNYQKLFMHAACNITALAASQIHENTGSTTRPRSALLQEAVDEQEIKLSRKARTNPSSPAQNRKGPLHGFGSFFSKFINSSRSRHASSTESSRLPSPQESAPTTPHSPTRQSSPTRDEFGGALKENPLWGMQLEQNSPSLLQERPPSLPEESESETGSATFI